MDRLAELAGYAQSFPGMVDEDFIAAGFTPEEISSYRSQINPQVTPFVPRPKDTLTQGPTSYRTTAPQGGYAEIYGSSVLARKKEEPPSVGFARDYMDFLPGIGDVIGAGEVAQELTSEDPNYPLATALGAATVIGAVPVVGDFVARAVAKTAQNVFDSPFGNKVLDYLRSVKTDAPGRPPLTFDEVEAAMKAETLAPQGIKAYQGSPHNFAAERLVRYPDGSTEYIVGSPDVLPDIPAGAEVLEDFPLGRMRMDKIGTGEGAQAYGHGIYSAEAEGVAKKYRNALSDTVMTPDGTPDLEKRAAQMALTFSDNTPEGAIAWLAKFKNGANHTSPAMTPELIDAVSARFRSGDFKPGGSMYEVNIAANPDDFLDWDMPLAGQQPSIRDRVRGLAPNASGMDSGLRLLDKIRQGLYARDVAGGGPRLTPGGVRDTYNEALSKELDSAGIPGIKYLDQGSRNTSGGEILGVQKTADGWTAKIRVDNRGGTGFQTPTQSVTTKKGFATEAEAMDWAKGKVSSGSRNFVVFDEKLISIVKKYGIAGAATMLGVSALDVEQALADNLAPSDWEDLVAGPQ